MGSGKKESQILAFLASYWSSPRIDFRSETKGRMSNRGEDQSGDVISPPLQAALRQLTVTLSRLLALSLLPAAAGCLSFSAIALRRWLPPAPIGSLRIGAPLSRGHLPKNPGSLRRAPYTHAYRLRSGLRFAPGKSERDE